MEKKLKKLKSLNTRSQGEIISAILLILLVIAASAVLISFVVPLVKDFLEKGKCNDYAGKLIITNNPKYSCYNSSSKNLLVQVKLDGSLEEEKAKSIRGVRIVIVSKGSSTIFDIIPPDSIPPMSINMLNGAALELPRLNQERTYSIPNINSRPNSTIIYPLLNNSQTCSGAAYTMDYIPFC